MILLLSAWDATAQSPPRDVLPDVAYDEGIPAPADFFSFPLGTRHLQHHQVVDYFRELGVTSGRVRIIPYATSHGKRPLLVAAISSEANLQNLDRIRDRRRRLTTGKLDSVPDEEPLVMYLGYSVHGDEASAVNAAPLVAYHLAACQSDDVQRWLDQSIFLVDPALNPDGIDRFANWANENRGRFASPEAIDREHQQPWPGGRTNYYWFDLNRDWLLLVHPESRGRLRLFHQWKPNVVLDFHEMSGTSSYFFQPGIPARNNPLTPAENFRITQQFARSHAQRMDAASELFYTEERYDDFYIGKGSTYPDLHGAIGILFEQGSTRGLQLKNERTDRTFADTVANQVRTSLSSLEAADQLRDELLDYQRRFYVDALQEAADESVSAYILTGEASRIHAAADLMCRHDIDVYQPQGSLQLDGQSYPRGQVAIVPYQQAETKMVQSLMEPRTSFRENIFYDVSTWHLPSAFDLDLHRHASDLPVGWLKDKLKLSGKSSTPFAVAEEREVDQIVGYLIAAESLHAPRLIARLQRTDADIRVTTKAMTLSRDIDARRWSPGTFVVLRQPNASRWSQIEKLLHASKKQNLAEIQSIGSSMTTEGPDLGSDTLLRIPRCEPVLVVGEGTDRYVAGAIWHHLDHRLALPATIVGTDYFSRASIENASCVVLPSGSYSSWDERQVEAIRGYVRRGGTLIGVASAVRWLAGKKLIELVSDSRNDDERDTDSEEASQEPENRQRPFGEARDLAALESIAGAFFHVDADRSHPLAFGFANQTVPVFRDHTTRFPLPANPYRVAATYTGLVAGYASERNVNRITDSAAVWAERSGDGRYILIADNPVFRGYVRSAEKFLTNAMLIGPALKIPSAPIE